MRRFVFLTITMMLLFAASVAQTTWNFDKAHSEVQFKVKHMVVSTVTGQFNDFNITFRTSKPDFTDAVVEGTVEVKSINTANSSRDKHLLSDDFFGADKFPQMKFKSTKFEKTGENTYKITGLLTIRDVTKEVTFDATYNGTVKSPWGKTVMGWTATTVINRFDFNLKWNQAIETGGLVVGKDVTIIINAEFTS